MQTAESSDACEDLRSILASERDAEILLRALGVWGPACYETEVPATLVTKLLDRPGLELEVRVRISDQLREMDPTPEAVQALIAQLGTRDKSLQHRVAWALGSYGEIELATVLPLLADPNVQVATGASAALGYAVDEPIDLPGLEAALERTTTASDAMLSAHARSALQKYRENMSKLPDAVGASLLKRNERLALRYFGVRRVYCSSKVAADAVARLRGSEDKEVASAARRAAALRTKRCQPSSPAEMR